MVGILAIGLLMQAVASTGPLSLASLDRVNITMAISIAEALGCVLLSALLPGVFGLGLIGLALGATLPRLIFGCAVYPWLAVSVLGPELKDAMWRDLTKNSFLCLSTALVFVAVLVVFSCHTWPSLFFAALVITVLHVLFFGNRYEIIAASRIHLWTMDWVLKFASKKQI